MRTEYYRAEDLAKVFRTQKIATMAELKDVLGSSADITIFPEADGAVLSDQLLPPRSVLHVG